MIVRFPFHTVFETPPEFYSGGVSLCPMRDSTFSFDIDFTMFLSQISEMARLALELE